MRCGACFTTSGVSRASRALATQAAPKPASVCVVSSPFKYSYLDPLAGESRSLFCSLRRVVSLYREANFVTDELSVRAARSEGAKPDTDLFFNARYFMQLDLGLVASPSRHFRIWDWFGISSDWDPWPAFGFATDAHCGPVLQGPPDYPYPDRKHKAFSWELERADRAFCVHIFSRCGHWAQVEKRDEFNRLVVDFLTH